MLPQDYLSVGPPVYIVVNNTAGQMNFADPRDQNLLCDGLEGCAVDSLGGQVSSWQKVSEESRIATTPLNWVNQYITWVTTEDADTDNLNCCSLYNHNENCMNMNSTGRPSTEQFG